MKQQGCDYSSRETTCFQILEKETTKKANQEQTRITEMKIGKATVT